MAFENAAVKGAPITVCYNRSKNGLTDQAVDVRGYNAINVQVLVTGGSPSADITMKGSYAEGGQYEQLSDPEAAQTGVAANTMFEVTVGTAFVRPELGSISGTFGNNQGFTLIITPFVSPGQTQVNVTNVASQNIAEYGGSAVGPSNPVDVEIQGSLPAGSAALGSVSLDHGIPCWAITQDSAANTAQTLTMAAEAAKKHYITALEVVLSGAAAGADIAIVLKDGATAKWKTIIGNAAAVGTRVTMAFPQPVELSENTAANLEVGGGGASAITTANLSGYTK